MTKSSKKLLAVVKAKAQLHYELMNGFKKDGNTEQENAYTNSYLALNSVIFMIEDKDHLQSIATILKVDLSTIQ